jgi:histidine triad (HIT) family protein
VERAVNFTYPKLEARDVYKEQTGMSVSQNQNEGVYPSDSFCIETLLTVFSMSTLFEKIIAREIPAKIEYEDGQCIVIHDIDPQAPTHLLVIPKQVIPRVAEATTENQAVLGHLLLTAASVAKKLNLDAGFRIVINNGKDGGEAVPHLHVHVLGGRAMAWPPG